VGAEYRQFDFWLGDWRVVDTTGQEVGTNLIVPKQDGCVVQENWASGASTGTSYNYYSQADSSWHQVWVDNSGGSLMLKGGLQGKSMVLRSDWQPGKKVDFYCNQITWTPLENGDVVQHWTVIAQDGRVLATPFKGIYKKKN
jgi:hypothetical protein